MSMTIAPMEPTSMNGLRTRNLSESTPKTIRATRSAHQNQAFNPLAWPVVRLRPFGFLKTVAQ